VVASAAAAFALQYGVAEVGTAAREETTLLESSEVRGSAARRYAHLVRDAYDAVEGSLLENRAAITGPPGKHAYALLAHLSQLLPRSTIAHFHLASSDSRFDHGLAAFALGSEPSSTVLSYGASRAQLAALSREQAPAQGGGQAARGASAAAESGLLASLARRAPNVHFRPGVRSVAALLRDELPLLLDCALVSLDCAGEAVGGGGYDDAAAAAGDGGAGANLEGGGEPCTAGAALPPAATPAVAQVIDALSGGGFRGVVVLRGIFQSSSMARWWRSVGRGCGPRAAPNRVTKHDVTHLGDGRLGTGLLDFGGQLAVL
jgi:hypothetical protein